MIDLHAHVLPNIDDGAQSLEEALLMTEFLNQQNVTTVVCTPHFDCLKTPIDEFVSKRSIAMNLMGDSKVTLISGSETNLHEYLFRCPDLNELCIKDTKYLLLELPYSEKYDKKIFDVIERLINYYDVIPIIAHVERYHALMKNSKGIHQLIDLGCLLQLNATSIMNEQKRDLAFHYIKHGYIDVLASDCHNMDRRPPMIADALNIITKKLGNNFSDTLMANAEKIVKGIDIHKKQDYLIGI